MKVHQPAIKKARDKFMSTRKIICTGDPSETKHIASGMKRFGLMLHLYTNQMDTI